MKIKSQTINSTCDNDNVGLIKYGRYNAVKNIYKFVIYEIIILHSYATETFLTSFLFKFSYCKDSEYTSYKCSKNSSTL